MQSKTNIEHLNQNVSDPRVDNTIGESNARALVITPHFTKRKSQNALGNGPHLKSEVQNSSHSSQSRLQEAVGLAKAINLEVVQSYIIPIAQPKPATLLGSGKVDELKAHIKIEKIELVIIDHALSPIQQRNLEREWQTKVLDRTGLILEIFGERAQTKEGRLQVELAHLDYQKSRLVRSWTHLERQRGGIGFMGGPGETQIEADRRMLQERITSLRADLEQVKRTRQLHRKGRKRRPYPIVALVGYTNAGKSTLFNMLTGADVLAKDLLFATLDPVMREITLPSGTKIILSDTVGFISDLPTTLIAAFRATLEEVFEADMILHVRDISHEETQAQKNDVDRVLEELGIQTDSQDVNIVHVWNKIDLLNPEEQSALKHLAARDDRMVALISAQQSQGIEALRHKIDEVILEAYDHRHIEVPAQSGAFLNWLYENSEVLERTTTSTGDIRCHIRISQDKNGKLNQLLRDIKS